jgi:hypothetical protein
VPDFDALHRDVSYDVDFDTSVTAVADAVRLIRDQLRSPATAFDVLRARRATST